MHEILLCPAIHASHWCWLKLNRLVEHEVAMFSCHNILSVYCAERMEPLASHLLLLLGVTV